MKNNKIISNVENRLSLKIVFKFIQENTTFPKDQLVVLLLDGNSNIVSLPINEVGGTNGVSEAPEDGNIYGRQDGEWESISESSIPSINQVLTIGNISSINMGFSSNASLIFFTEDGYLQNLKASTESDSGALSDMVISLPKQRDHNVVLATTEDINWKSIVEGGAYSTDNIGIDVFSGENPYFEFTVNRAGGFSQLYIDNEDIKLLSSSATKIWAIGTDQDSAEEFSITASGNSGLNRTKLYFEDFENLTENVNIAIPRLAEGNYTLSIAKVYSDATTVVKSSATLTDDYPNALIGDKVHALSIIAGALIYEKTATGWIQIVVTLVV